MLRLEQVRDLTAKIRKQEQKLECIRKKTITPPRIDSLPKSQARSSATERIAIQIVDTERELAALRIELEPAKEKLSVAILDSVSEPIQATCLILYYVACETQKKISERLNCQYKAILKYMRDGRAEYNSQG